MRRTIVFCAACALVAAAVMTAGCADSESAASNNPGGSEGSGGSMARFTIIGDWLYTVDNYRLRVVSLADPAKPIEVESVNIGFEIETIFALDDYLFIGSMGAMYIYDVSRPEFPKQLSVTSHLRSCDPVVAADTLAFVTLNSSTGSWCGAAGNELQVFDISDMTYPEQICTVGLSSPRGLAVDLTQKMLFVCDNGLKVFDISDPRDVEGLYTAASLPEVGRIDAYDCILWDGRLLVIGADGLYQLDYDREKFTFISKIDLRPEQ